MDKKGGIEDILVYVLQLVVLIIVVGGIFGLVKNQAEGKAYEKKYFGRDFALLYDTLLLSRHPLDVNYDLLKDQYGIEISQEKEITYVSIGRKDDFTFLGNTYNTQYPLITISSSTPTLQSLNLPDISTQGVKSLSISGNGKIIRLSELQEISTDQPYITSEQEGTLAYPVEITDHTITSCFGLRDEALNLENEPTALDCSNPNYHCGVDFRGRNHERVLAVTAGNVTSVLFGNENWGTIVLKPDDLEGTQFVYIHLDSPCPYPGQCITEGKHVTKGEPLGIAGNNKPESYKADISRHLHFEMVYNNKKVDPLASGLFDLKQFTFKQGSNCDTNRNAYSYKDAISRGISQ